MEREISEKADKFWLRTDKGYFEKVGKSYEPVVFDNNYFYEFTYTDNDGKIKKYPHMADGNARLANEEDLARDKLGFTNPNLHRRINPQEPVIADNPLNQELEPRRYTLSVHGVYSYRTTELTVHDEEQEYLEIP